MIGPFEMVLGIVFIVMVASVLKSRQSQAPHSDQVAEYEREISDMRHRIEKMETRIRTLERITTDPERELDRKISRLG